MHSPTRRQARAHDRVARRIAAEPDWTSRVKAAVAARIVAMIAAGTTATPKLAEFTGATTASVEIFRTSRMPDDLVRDVERAVWAKEARPRRGTR